MGDYTTSLKLCALTLLCGLGVSPKESSGIGNTLVRGVSSCRDRYEIPVRPIFGVSFPLVLLRYHRVWQPGQA